MYEIVTENMKMATVIPCYRTVVASLNKDPIHDVTYETAFLF